MASTDAGSVGGGYDGEFDLAFSHGLHRRGVGGGRVRRGGRPGCSLGLHRRGVGGGGVGGGGRSAFSHGLHRRGVGGGRVRRGVRFSFQSWPPPTRGRWGAGTTGSSI